ncbi:MAG: aminotransferase class V-fold PLP-dependent enzyme [bacterium]|nr:aminotransferase class V-fold PLP-dependent enzyme [bacterium]
MKEGILDDFKYLPENSHYFDSACQSLRPQPVLDALNDYYLNFNSCGERVKYAWGRKVDEKVAESREAVLDLLKLKEKDYFVSFTLNTTYGLNLLLSQLELPVSKVITSEIEHNSVFLSTMEFAKKHQIERIILPREADGSISLENDFSKSLVVVNASSNIDGRRLENIAKLVKQIKKQGGFIIIDAAQALGSSYELLQKIPADAIVFSAHKMYSASLGIMVVRKDFAKFVKTSFVGGGMVANVAQDSYELLSGEHIHALFEPGLQAWGEIIALKTAIDWLKKQKKKSQIGEFSKEIFEFLGRQNGVQIINQKASPVISFYHEKLDAHLIAQALSDEGIMVRSGYFCCHYYLKEVKKYPHLVRISLGLHNSREDVEKLKAVLERIFE